MDSQAEALDGGGADGSGAFRHRPGGPREYGWRSTGQGPDGIYLARTAESGLDQPQAWKVYTGLDGTTPQWGDCASAARPLPIQAGDTGFSVDAVNGSLWLVQFDYTSGQLNAAGAISAHPSATPWGFGNTAVPLYSPPTGYVTYPYYYQDYEARIQPGLGSPGQVVISYNVNTLSVTPAASARTITTPRFTGPASSTCRPRSSTPRTPRPYRDQPTREAP